MPVLGWRKVGCPGAVTLQRPKSGSKKTRPIKSEPSREGDGREEMGSGGGVNKVGSSKGEERVREKIQLVGCAGVRRGGDKDDVRAIMG